MTEKLDMVKDENPIIRKILKYLTDKEILITNLKNLPDKDRNEILLPFFQESLANCFICNLCSKIDIKKPKICSSCETKSCLTYYLCNNGNCQQCHNN